MTTPIHLDPTGSSPTETKKQGCCCAGDHDRHEAESPPKDEGCCGGHGHDKEKSGAKEESCCGGDHAEH